MIKNILVKIMCLFFLSASIHAADTSANKVTKKQARLVATLYKAMKKGKFDEMAEYIKQDPSILNLHNKNGRTPAEEATHKELSLLAGALFSHKTWKAAMNARENIEDEFKKNHRRNFSESMIKSGAFGEKKKRQLKALEKIDS